MRTALLFVALAAPAHAGTILLDPAAPTVGEPVAIHVQGVAADDVTVVDGPGSSLSASRTLPLTDGVGTWTPTAPGIVELSAGPEDARVTHTVSVRFDGPPPLGIAVFLGAGGLLFGLAAFGMGRIFRGRERGLDTVEGPFDT